jgi:predicted transcriptional regulator
MVFDYTCPGSFVKVPGKRFNLCGMKGKEVAKIMGVSGCAVSLGIRSLTELMAENKRLKKKVEALTFN